MQAVQPIPTPAKLQTQIIGDFCTKDSYFQPREELASAIQSALTKKHFVTLTGPRGIGKTTEVAAYIADQFEQKTYELIFWAREAYWERDCLAICTALQQTNWQAVHQYLSNCPQKWLLVLDGVTAKRLDSLPNTSENGHILATSRQPSCPGAIRMPLFTHQEALDLFYQILPPAGIKEKVDQAKNFIGLADFMGNYPWAIASVARIKVRSHIEPHYLRSLFTDYRKLFLEQAFSTEMCDTIDEQLSGLARTRPPAYTLLGYCAHLNASFIPRQLIETLMSSAYTADTVKNRISDLLLFLIQEGLMEHISDNGNGYIIPSAILLALRYYFSRQPQQLYLRQLATLLPKLTAEFSTIRSQLNHPDELIVLRFYSIHVKSLIERMCELYQPLPSEYDKFVSFKERSEAEKIAISERLYRLAQQLSQAAGTSVDEALMPILLLLSEFTKQLKDDEKLDTARFYIGIMSKIIMSNFDFVTKDQPITPQQWQRYQAPYRLYFTMLILQGSIDARYALDYLPDIYQNTLATANSALRLFEHMYQYLLMPGSQEIATTDKRQLFKLIYLFIYAHRKSLDFATPIATFSNRALDAILEFHQASPVQGAHCLIKLPAPTLRPPLQVALFFSPGDESDRLTILNYYIIKAGWTKRWRQQLRYEFHQQQLLMKAKDPHYLLRILSADLADKHTPHYELDRLLALLPLQAAERVTLQSRFADLKQSVIAKKTLTPDSLKTLSAFVNSLLTHILPVRQIIQAPQVLSPLAIKILEEGLQHPLIQPLVTDTNPAALGKDRLGCYFRKLAKYYLQQYRILVENGDIPQRHEMLKQALGYLLKAKNILQNYYHRDELLTEMASIFISLLEVVTHYQREKLSLTQDAKKFDASWQPSQDKWIDYYLRCRFIISQLFDGAWHFARKLFYVAAELQLDAANSQFIFPTHKNIFAITPTCSRPYYELQLETIDPNQLDDPFLRYVRACRLLDLAMYDEAIKEFNLYLQYIPSSSMAYARKASAEIQLGNYPSAYINATFARILHGNSDTLVDTYVQSANRQLASIILGVNQLIVPNSNQDRFLKTLTSAFAQQLQHYLDIATDNTSELSRKEIAVRVLQAITKLLPKSISFMGTGIEIPLGEGLAEFPTLALDIEQHRQKYAANNIVKTRIDPAELNQNATFHSVCLKLLAMFHFSIAKLTPFGTSQFAQYIAESMTGYLASDRQVPFYSLYTKLLEGATEGKRQLATNERLPTSAGVTWRASKIVRAPILTPEGAWFRHPRGPLKSYYMPQDRTEEEARENDYISVQPPRHPLFPLER